MVAPAKDTLVGTSQRRGGLHAAVGLDAIEAMLVAAASTPQHGLGPTAQLHSAVGPCSHGTSLAQNIAVSQLCTAMQICSDSSTMLRESSAVSRNSTSTALWYKLCLQQGYKLISKS